ncbi:BolA family protein [Stagnihabitans tardus]|uniref:BolA/IbaG family iron-sulfur metabolism protein n=1 Tax=Stagnihabitans tardus TaxID=2699202 RepID=A0AAE4YCI9_9RHOB|nr:BolA family protein [Stagnihabitans tardus]NBZ87719.1 BolA/IbaG family iron-sulfur metabolism protein [Stagnihabitans tardus]
MALKDEIETRLRAAFSVTELRVENESHKHAGHAGDDGTGESHFAIYLRAEELGPMGRLARHRAVQAALGDIHQRLHALAMDLG